jgi:hypothetical protein
MLLSKFSEAYLARLTSYKELHARQFLFNASVKRAALADPQF